MSKRYIVTGAGGFIGSHLVNRLKSDGHYVRAVSSHAPRWSESPADEFIAVDLRTQENTRRAFGGAFDGLFMLAADSGGLVYMENAGRQAQIAYNNTLINTHSLACAAMQDIPRVVFISSAVVYPEVVVRDIVDIGDIRPMATLREDMAHPADPQEGMYGWNKLYTEKMCDAFAAAYPMSCHIVRLHNCYGPGITWQGGREKAPAALCRKVAQAILNNDDFIEIIGSGKAKRSFMHINDCIEGLTRIMGHGFYLPPLNLGSSEMVTIYDLAGMIMQVAGVDLHIRHVEGPVGVMGRNSDNTLIRKYLDWEPQVDLQGGIADLYHWVEQQVAKKVAH